MNLDDLAAVYLVTKKGGFKGICYIMSIDDAQVFCGDKRTKGKGMGSEWMFVWTNLSHIVDFNEVYKNKHAGCEKPKLLIMKDNGSRDNVINENNIKKIPLNELREYFDIIEK